MALTSAATSWVREGHFGAVYAARLGSLSSETEPTVALKVFHPGSDHDLYELEVENLSKASRAPEEVKVVRLVASYEHNGSYCIAHDAHATVVASRMRSVLGRLHTMFKRPWNGCFRYVNMAGAVSCELTRAAEESLMMMCLWCGIVAHSQVAKTLHALHTTFGIRLYHGDVNPRNVLLKETDGRRDAYLADLGVSAHNSPYGLTGETLPFER
jgi:serine/threonine protein kinase